MIREDGNTSEMPAQTALEQENFKLRMERDAFKAQYEQQAKKMQAQMDAMNALKLAVEHKDMVIANAFELVRLMKAELYGKSSEKSKFFEAACSNLFDEAELTDLMDSMDGEPGSGEPDDRPGEDSVEDVADEKKPRKAHKKQELTRLPADTPVIDVDHTDEVEVPIDVHTGKSMVQVGVRTELKIGRHQQTVIYRHLFPVFSPEEDYEADREYDETNRVVAYPGQQRVLKGAMISNEVLAQIVSSKYLDHMPLNRQEQYFARMGLSISRQNMKNWIYMAAPRCGPLIELLKTSLLGCDLINMDETPHRVLTVDGEASDGEHYEIIQVGTNDAYRVVVYSFNVKRNAQVFASLLKDYTGALMVDGHASYRVAVKEHLNGLDCVKLACWAHARRYFLDLIKSNSKAKSRGILSLISKLYRIETELRPLVENQEITREEFLDRRVQQTKPVFDKIKKWLDAAQGRAVTGELLARAVNYTLNRWDELVSYPFIYHATPDNNLAERFTRPFSIGSGNWLFSDTDQGAMVSSVLFTLAQNGKLNGLNEIDYLWAVLDRIPLCKSEEDWKALLPWNIDLSDIVQKKALLAAAKADPERTEPYIIRGGRY